MKEPVRRHVTQKKREITNSKKFENQAMLENDYRFEIKLPLVSTLPTGSAYEVSVREQLTSLRYNFFYFSKMRYVAQINKFFRFSFDDSFSLVCKDIFNRFFFMDSLLNVLHRWIQFIPVINRLESGVGYISIFFILITLHLVDFGIFKKVEFWENAYFFEIKPK